MSISKLISVIIPVYNREHSIDVAVQSVLSQTYLNFELILVDDCSTDNSWERLQSYNDVRIKCYKLSKNSGAAAARNYGIKHANGAYISLLDSDDYYEKGFLETTVEVLANSPQDVGFMWTGVRYIEDQEKKEFSWVPKRLATPYVTFLNSLHIGTNSGITFKKEVFDICGFFNDELPAAEDTDFFLRVTQKFDYAYSNKILINIERDGEDRLSKNFVKIADAYNRFIPEHFPIINESEALRKKFYYKLMWLNYQANNKDLARKYYQLIPKNELKIKLKSFVIYSFYELLPLPLATKMHLNFAK